MKFEEINWNHYCILTQKSDREISRISGVCPATIWAYRKNLRKSNKRRALVFANAIKSLLPPGCKTSDIDQFIIENQLQQPSKMVLHYPDDFDNIDKLSEYDLKLIGKAWKQKCVAETIRTAKYSFTMFRIWQLNNVGYDVVFGVGPEREYSDLDKIMKENNISAKELCRKIHVCDLFYYNMKKVNIKCQTMLNIALVLNVTFVFKKKNSRESLLLTD